MEVVRAGFQDLRQISRIISALDFPGHSFSVAAMVKDHIAHGRYFVSRHEGETVGAMALIERDGACQIYSITSVRKGAGRAMVEFAVEECRSDGIPKLWCWSLTRYKAKGFYEKMGFEEQVLLRKQWYGEDCYFFGKVVGEREL